MQVETYKIRIKHDGGVVAITTTATTWTQAVAQVLEAEGALSSAFINCFRHIQGGETVWNGAKINQSMADAYNRINDHIHAWEATGRQAPEQLLNGRHNLLSNVV